MNNENEVINDIPHQKARRADLSQRANNIGLKIQWDDADGGKRHNVVDMKIDQPITGGSGLSFDEVARTIDKLTKENKG